MNSPLARSALLGPVLSMLLLANLYSTATAQLPSARLMNLFPPGGQAGGTCEVTVVGTDLDALTELRFSHRGIHAASRQSNRFEVRVAKDVPPGVYDVRAIGKYGASNPRTFSVGTLAELREEQNSADSPQAVKLESTINGRTDANGIDYYRFEANGGQRILIRCETRTLESRLEPVLALHDAAGREIARSRSGTLLHEAGGGEFTLQIHDITYRGGPEFFYRLSIGTFPNIDYVLPMPMSGGGNGGTAFAVFGQNLSDEAKETSDLERAVVELTPEGTGLNRAAALHPAQHGLDLFEFRLRNKKGISAGALVRFATAPMVAEAEPNNSSANAQKITPPCEVAGQMFPVRDRDWFSFEARKGDVYWIEVFSHRLGSPTDPFLVVQRAGTNGATDVLELNDSEPNIGGTDFNTAHRDPAGRFEAKQDGHYLVQLRDLFTHPPHTSGLIYHLRIGKPSPDFRLAALPVAPLPVKKDAKDIAVATTVLRRGEVVPVKIVALRQEGFNDAIEISAVDLPKGVSAAPARIESGKSSTLIFLQAAEGCPITLAPIKFRASRIGGKELVHDATAASVSWPVADPQAEPVLSRENAEFVVSTIDELFPVRLAAAEEKTWEGASGSKLRIPLRLTVDGELSGNLKLKPAGAPGLDAVKEFELDPKSTNAVFEIDPGQSKLAPGMYSFALQGSAQVKPASTAKGEKKKETALTVYSTPITLKITPPLVAHTNSPAK